MRIHFYLKILKVFVFLGLIMGYYSVLFIDDCLWWILMGDVFDDDDVEVVCFFGV